MSGIATSLTARLRDAAARVNRAAWLAAALAGATLAAPAPAQTTSPEAPPVADVSVLDDISVGRGPASAPQILGKGPDAITVGWCVESGDHEGVYLRRRTDLLWEPEPIRIDTGAGGAPRDLALAVSESAVHGAWTAVRDQERRLFLACFDSESGVAAPIEVTGPGEGDADYPIVLPRPGGSLWIVWQAARLTDFTIESAEVQPRDGSVRRLPPVSGDSRSAVAPRALHTHPPVIAWNEIGGDSNRIRVNYLEYIGNRWDPSAMADFLHELAPDRTTIGAALENTYLPYAFWIEPPTAGGESAVSVLQAPLSGPAVAPLRVTAPGAVGAIYDQPELKLISNDVLTLAWRTYNSREQAIQLARVDWPRGEARVVRVSDERADYPSNPSHVSHENWSAVTWADDTTDGGSGRLGFAEVHWNGAPEPALTEPAADGGAS